MTPKVLIVDDDKALIQLVAATLDTQGWTLLTATDGASALDLVQRERPQLVLLDIQMPDMSGIEVCRRIKADPATRDTVVIILTAMSREEDRQAALQAGADDYITKPFSPLQLLTRVQHAFTPTAPPELPVPVDRPASPPASGEDLVNAQLLAYAEDLKVLTEAARRGLAEARAASVSIARVLLQALELRLPGSMAHAGRVARYAGALARHLNLSPDEHQAVQLGALLHDIGMLAIPTAIPPETGTLPRDELAWVRRHPELGARILSGVPMYRNIVPIVHGHHERPDGWGYPRRLREHELPLTAHVVAAAELLDNLVHPANTTPVPLEVAVETLRGWAPGGVQRDCARALLAAWRAGDLNER
jgi:putative two-component system response regulator